MKVKFPIKLRLDGGEIQKNTLNLMMTIIPESDFKQQAISLKEPPAPVKIPDSYFYPKQPEEVKTESPVKEAPI